MVDPTSALITATWARALTRGDPLEPTRRDHLREMAVLEAARRPNHCVHLSEALAWAGVDGRGEDGMPPDDRQQGESMIKTFGPTQLWTSAGLETSILDSIRTATPRETSFVYVVTCPKRDPQLAACVHVKCEPQQMSREGGRDAIGGLGVMSVRVLDCSCTDTPVDVVFPTWSQHHDHTPFTNWMTRCQRPHLLAAFTSFNPVKASG